MLYSLEVTNVLTVNVRTYEIKFIVKAEFTKDINIDDGDCYEVKISKR